MKKFLTSYFTYNFEINQSLAERFKSYDFKVDGEIVRMANHVLNAHQVWLDRIKGDSSLSSPWENFPLESFEERNQELYKRTLDLIESCDPNQIIVFKTFAGAEFSKKFSDILIHAVNHSTYHRGQIALLMRRHGLEPIASDYIHWVS